MTTTEYTPAEAVTERVDRAGARGSGRKPVRAALAGVALAAIWAVFNPGDHASWVIGIPAVAIGAASTLLFDAAPSHPRSLPASIRFAGYFAWQSVVGATDVALRAFRPRPSLSPGFMEWRTQLPEGAPRHLLANTVTLLPGTLTASLDGDRLTIHMLDTGADPGLEALEARVAAVFGLNGEAPR